MPKQNIISLQKLLSCNGVCLKYLWNNAENAGGFPVTKLKGKELDSWSIRMLVSMHILSQMF